MKSKPPYILLFIVGVALLLISIFPNDRTIDIHLHDTVFIIAAQQIQIGLGTLRLFLWIVYSLLQKFFLFKILIWIHIVITVLFLIFLVIVPYTESSDSPRQYNDAHYFFVKFTTAFSFVWLVTQLLFIFNILAGLIIKIIKRWRDCDGAKDATRSNKADKNYKCQYN